MPEESDHPTLTGAPPQAFPDVGGLLWRTEVWGEWLEKHPNEAELLKAAYNWLVRLSSHTGWGEERVLERLGCPATSEEELRELTPERLGDCRAYFQWVESLLRPLDVAADKRLAVSGAARLFARAEKSVTLCEEVMAAGPFAGLEYLRLGEIAQSWQAALRELPSRRGDRARATATLNPFADEGMAHLSPKRLDLLNEKDASALLGPRVEQRMREHVRSCGTCGEAYEERSSTLRLRGEVDRARELLATAI